MGLEAALPTPLSSFPSPSALGELPLELLFSAVAKPVLVAEAATGSIVEANPAAATLLGTTRRALVGHLLEEAFTASSSQVLRLGFARAKRTGSTAPISVHLYNGGKELTVEFSLVRVPPQSYLLVHLAAPSVSDREESSPSPVLEAIEDSPLGFLIVDGELRVEYANRAFIEMVGLEAMDDLHAQPLTRWVALSASDFVQLSAQMAQRIAVSTLRSRLCCTAAGTRDVELYAVAVPHEHHPRWAFSVRPRIHLN